MWQRTRAFGRAHWPLGVVLLVAVLMRTTNLFPTFVYGDDAEYSIVARSLMHDPRALAYPDLESFGARPFVSQPPLILYLFAAAGSVVGPEVGPVVVSVMLGVATCGLIYGLGVFLQNRTVGAVAGLVLAVLPPHVNLSRKSFLDVGLTFFMTLTILCFVLWLERRTVALAVTTGLCAAATMLSKLPGVLVAVPLMAGFAMAWRQQGKVNDTSPLGGARLRAHALRRRDLRHATWALVPIASLGFVYLALLWYLRASVDLFEKLGWQAGRVASSGSSGPGGLPDRPWHWYFSDGGLGMFPQFGVVVVLLSIVGLALLVAQLIRFPGRREAHVVVLAWVLAILVVFTLSRRKEWFYILPAAPGVALLAALPFGPWMAQRLRPWTHRLSRPSARPRTWTALGLTLAVLLAIVPPAVVATRDVVLDERSYGYGVKEAAKWIHDQDPTAGQIGTLLGRFSLKFYNGQPTYHWYAPHAFVESEIEAGQVRYLVWDDYLNLTYEGDWMRGLVDRHDGQVVQEYHVGSERVRVRVYELAPA